MAERQVNPAFDTAPVDASKAPLQPNFLSAETFLHPGGLATQTLTDRVLSLEAENAGLKKLVAETKQSLTDLAEPTPKWLIAYRINEVSFLREPSWVITGEKTLSLKGEWPIGDLEQYLRRCGDLTFVVYKDYSKTSIDRLEARNALEKGRISPPTPDAETIRLMSSEMLEAAEAFFNVQPNFRTHFGDVNVKVGILKAPYLFWYCYRKPDAFEQLQPRQQVLMIALTHWIESCYGQEYFDVDSRLAEGYLSRTSMTYYIQPGDVLVLRKDGKLKTFMATSWTIERDFHIGRPRHGVYDAVLDGPARNYVWVYKVMG
ncbi:MAG: hypothetical protein MMC33_010561 [Icmadophila ericetorum]|nr:hypothetical protein [Icmadophila ericetorum]